ncbi:Werner Syndrome-like exonuclease isoform X1 [Juglans regia]|uniref:3'-5' exonuclease n=2 Tax=Juglans regia TaxID=51240 RepID=A0A2I4GJJ3_JUGRE|nr:Werner Syndrome-like exonuclease isoform X1 [Juglans regia]
MEWDQPLTDEDIQAIDAAIQSAPSSSLSKKRRSSPDARNDPEESDPPKTLRQLPSSLLALQHPNPLLSPCQANTGMRYPVMKFGGRILYSQTSIEVEKAAKELLKNLELEKRESGQVVLGLDIEWRPTFKKGVAARKAAVMQICGDTSHCHVMHIFHSGIPQSLQFLLEDPTLLKVGIGIGSDAAKIFKDYCISIKAVEDLCCLAKQKLGGHSQKWGLASLTKMLISKELRKPNKIRLGNWEKILSNEQLEYAATDAFASWYLYQVLKGLPNSEEEVAADKGIEELEGVKS